MSGHLRRLLPLALLWAVPALGVRDVPHMEGSCWPDLAIPAATSRTGIHDAAVVVGISEYYHLPPVVGAAAMADEWATFLRQSLGVPKRKLVVLQNEAATLEAVAGAVTDLVAEVEDGGALWIIFAGHGVLGGPAREPLLLDSDAPAGGPELAAHGLSLSSLRQTCASGGQSRTVLVLDTGFGARDTEGCPLVADLTVADVSSHLESWNQAVVFLARAPDEPAPKFPGLERPAFSYLLLGALRGWADIDDNAMITAREALEYVRGAYGQVLPDAPLSPLLRGVAGTILSAAREPAPDLGALLWAEAELRLARRQQRLDIAGTRLREKAQEDWTSLQPMLERGGEEAWTTLLAFIDRYRHPVVSVDGLSRWIVLPELEEARTRRAEAAGQRAPEVDDLAYLQQELVQIQDEMKQLTRRNSWKGVEDKFTQAEALAARGVSLDFETLYLAAQAARGLGQINLVYARLEQAVSVENRAEALAWLNEVASNYGRVHLRNQRREPVILSALQMPFAPDQRSAITLAWEQVEQTGNYEGLLPRGVYTFGEKTFMVVPGDPTVEIQLMREKRKQDKSGG